MSAARDAASVRQTLPMSVARMGFLVERLNQDCSPLQYLRELTQNAIESIQRLDKQTGEIRWDVDWPRFELSDDAIQKLCIIDTGIGMTGEEMVEYINKLSSSIHKQSATGNFGVGAKISAAPLNPAGLIYLSWKEGKGYMIHLAKDEVTGEYGLVRFTNGEFWQHINSMVKPEIIQDHGTVVVLLGKDDAQNTVEPPPNVRMPRKWILRYLNSRFFKIPEGIELKVREGWDLPRGDKHNFLRTVTGQGVWLDHHAQAKGSVELKDTGATAHWWIIKEGADDNSGHYTPNGHVGALFQNEIYELVQGAAGIARLQAFGVVFGGSRVVIYLEPRDLTDRSVNANTARTQLLVGNEPMDWAAYAAEFRANMPSELADYQNDIGSVAGNGDYRRAIKERLKTVQDLFRFGRYRPSEGGRFTAVPTENSGGSAVRAGNSQSGGSGNGGGRGGRRGDMYALFAENEGEAANFVALSNEPECRWVSIEDGTRSDGDLEGRAARYLAEQNLLLINGDFKVFADMEARWTLRYEHVPGAKQAIREVVREWFEQQLLEAVMSALALKQSIPMSVQELRELWSESALTSAILPRYHIDMSIKRILGQRLGKLATAA